MIHFSYVAIQVTQLYLLKGSSPVALMRLCPKCSACVSVRLSLDPVLHSTALLANTTLAALLQFWNKSSYLTRLEIKGVVTFWWTIYESTKGAFVCCSVTKLCPTLCDLMDCSTPGFSVHHQLLELAQTHVLCVDATQPSLLLFPPSPPACNHSQHQGLFQ